MIAGVAVRLLVPQRSLSGEPVVLVELLVRRTGVRASALALLVAQVLADHLDATVPADHLALVADLLNAGSNFHGVSLRSTRRVKLGD